MLRVSKQSDRATLVDATGLAAAAFGSATGAVDAAAGALLGVNPTDLTILGVLYGRRRLTAGAAASAARLSPAATSTAIQRLLAAGHITRTADPDDRRRALLMLTPEAQQLLERAYEPIGIEGRAALDAYSDAELRVIERFLASGRELQLAHAERIRGLKPSSS